MELGTIEREGRMQAFRRVDGEVSLLPFADVGELLESESWRDIVGQPATDPEPHELRTPVLRPGAVICVGLNYHQHAAEVGKAPPTHPTLFAKFPHAIVGPTDDLLLPPPDVSVQIDWEAELVIVIGASVKRADLDTAQAAIVGYTIMNDISVRDWQRRTDEWFQGKNFDRTTPIGPVIVTSDEFDPAAGQRIETVVNGVLEQSGQTNDLIFPPAELVAYISQFMTLHPGDLIATGTPSGVGVARFPQHFLADGDTVVTRIDGIGELRNRCVVDNGGALR